jgi:protein tyrosine phosphatase
VIKNQIIASQGPLKNTVADFWNMVSQEEVCLIVTTCNLVEGERKKCEKFWPDPSSDPLSHQFKPKKISVEFISEEKLTNHLVVRKFKLNDSEFRRKDMIVKQLHYTGWPDHGVPSGTTMESFSAMLDLFVDFLLQQDLSKKAIIHCSAGIGRTGTTIGLAHLLINTWA